MRGRARASAPAAHSGARQRHHRARSRGDGGAAAAKRGAETLRIRALTELAERTSQQTRRALEHERSAELRTNPQRRAQVTVAAASSGPIATAWLRFVLDAASAAQHTPSRSVAELARLSEDVSLRAEFALHAARCRSIDQNQDDTDALLNALGLHEDFPSTLGSALALCEALDAADDPDTRVLALDAYAKQLPAEQAAEDSRCAGARLPGRGLGDGSAEPARRAGAELSDDPSYWESLRVRARVAGDYEQVVVACDALAKQLPVPAAPRMLEEAAGVLHERLGRRDEAEQRAARGVVRVAIA